jgi:uncharacterized protein YbjQ (UPF0145 family)
LLAADRILIGGRSEAYEGELDKGRSEALSEMERRRSPLTRRSDNAGAAPARAIVGERSADEAPMRPKEG